MAAKKGGSQWPDWMKPGLRVVRGPDWKQTIRDASSVDLGTLSYVPKQAADNKVNVVWDTGLARSFRSGYKGVYDLRAYDNQQVGVEHKNKKCAECDNNPLRGIRYHCQMCKLDLCTRCYHIKDKHSLDHPFLRYDTPNCNEKIYLAPRSKTNKKLKVMGVFEKSEVIRGPHWNYPNKDGGDTNKGTVMAFIPMKDGVANGWVRIKWEIGNEVEEYRFGVNGFVDVVAFKATCGGEIYVDHLPVVGIIKLKKGDKVAVNMELAEFKSAQTTAKVPGGWKDEMKQCLSEIGTIVEYATNLDLCTLQYKDGKMFNVWKAALYRVSGYTEGGAATIMKDAAAVKKLQEGHGGYSPEMAKVCGKMGRIVKIQEDGDMKIFVDGNKFTFNPTCCEPVEDPKVARKAPQMPSDDEDDEPDGDCVPGRKFGDTETTVTKDKEEIATFSVQISSLVGNVMSQQGGADASVGNQMFTALTQADLKQVEKLIKNNKDLVNFKTEGRTILHMACHEGYQKLVVFLIDHQADLQAKDEEGDTPLHYAAFGKQPDCVQEMLQNAADPNAQNNNGITPLIIAVNTPCIDSVQCLILNNADVNLMTADGDTAMHDAVEQTEGQPVIVQAVIGSPKADHSLKNSKEFNVLQWAVLRDNKAAVRLILDKMSSIVNDPLEGGMTALHISAANDFVEITSLLLDAGNADPNIRDDEGVSPLHVAVAQAHKRIIEVLVDKKADVNAQDKNGDTPLHFAQMKQPLGASRSTKARSKTTDGSGHIQITYFLLEKGADLYKKNNKDETPMDLVVDPAVKTMLGRLTAAYQEAPAKSQKGVRLPINWRPMNVTDLDLVKLETSDAAQKQEYAEVEKHFKKTLEHAEVKVIKRVQNPLLWEHFTLKKREMESKYGQGCANELHLYHGTRPDIVDIIAHGNFDFRIAGSRVGALYGDGSYFATTAKYSDLYASTDDQTGLKVMFVAKVLVGKTCLGAPGLKRPPQVDPDNFRKGMYDAVVNNVLNPTIYCVFDMNQYYPEYIIEYR